MNRKPDKLPESNDPLDALLRDADTHIPDHGFTGRVLSSLPRRRRPWLRPILLSSATLLGAGMAMWLLPSPAVVIASLSSETSAWRLQTLFMLVPTLAVFSSLAWGVLAMVNDQD